MLKNKAFGSILGLSFIISVGSVGCAKRGEAWRGTIQEVDGVTVVKNPKEPMYGAESCIVEEDLSIGKAEAGGEFPFSEILDVGVDEQENIYVLDSKEAQISVFNKAGEYLRTIGKKGQGPGEMQRPRNVYITPGNEILVSDRPRFLHFFMLSGEYLRSISLGRIPLISRPKVDSQNDIIGRYTLFGPSRASFVLAKLDSGLNEIIRIFSYEYDITPKIHNVYPPECFWDVRKDDGIVWGYSDKYELQVLDGSGRIRQKIIKDYVPMAITEEEKREWLDFAFGDKGVPPDEKVIWEKHHNAFHSLHVDDSSRIFVETYEKAIEGRGLYYDIFDPEGRFIAKIALRSAPRVVKMDRIYSIEEDEQGYQVVKRYQMTWKF